MGTLVRVLILATLYYRTIPQTSNITDSIGIQIKNSFTSLFKPVISNNLDHEFFKSTI